MSLLFFDIETLPSSSPAVIAHLIAKEQRKSPGVLLDQITARCQAALAKTSLSGTFGELACICVAREAGEAEEVSFDAFLDLRQTETVVGHNITGFDLSFLRKLAIKQGKKWEWKPCEDTMSLWDRQEMTSLDALCLALGVDRGTDLTGGSIADLWYSGHRKSVIDKCKADVVATRECYFRIVGGV